MIEHPVARSDPAGRRVLATLSILMGVAAIFTDLYLPALPRMTQALAASLGQMELTTSAYLVGFILGSGLI